MPVSTVTVELTNKCDLNCKFCLEKKESSLKFSTLKHIVKESQKVCPPIKFLEFGYSGSPLLYKKFEDVLKLLQKNKMGANFVTNGFNLKWNLGFIDDELLKNVSFSVYLESGDEKKCEMFTGEKKYYRKTIEAMEYMNDRKIPHSVFMRVTSLNYQEIETVLEISKFYSTQAFFPIEVFPFFDPDLVLTDDMKTEVIGKINTLQNYGEPIRKVIQFSDVSGNCTYNRMDRLFVNSAGKMAFCHFLASMNTTEMFDVKRSKLSKLIEANNRMRKKYVNKKVKDLKKWEVPRRTISPCSYCLHHFGVEKKW